MSADRHKSFIATVVDADGETYEYISIARNRRTAKKEVGASAGTWGATVVAIEPLVTRKRLPRRRELFVASVTFGVSVFAISGLMLLALSLEGLL